MISSFDQSSLRGRSDHRGPRHARAAHVLVLVFGSFPCSCGVTPSQGSAERAGGSASTPTGCLIHGLLPDGRCTPGASQTTDPAIICGTLTESRREVSEETRALAFAEYGLSPHQAPGAYELDHLIPLELGGSNDIDNLWPEAAPGFHWKDEVENTLHDSVCRGRMSVGDAQRSIAGDWTQFLQR